MCVRNRLASVLYKFVVVFLCFFALFYNTGLQYGIGSFQLSTFNYFPIISLFVFFVFYLFAIIFGLVDIAKRGIKGESSFGIHLKGTLILCSFLNTVLLWSYIGPSFAALQSSAFSPQTLVAIFQPVVIPIAIFLDWLLFDKKGRFFLSDPVLWLLPVYLYYAYIFVRAQFGLVFHDGSNYPYSFINPTTSGWGDVLRNLLFGTIGYLVVGFLLVLLDRLLAPKKQRKAAELEPSALPSEDITEELAPSADTLAVAGYTEDSSPVPQAANTTPLFAEETPIGEEEPVFLFGSNEPSPHFLFDENDIDIPAATPIPTPAPAPAPPQPDNALSGYPKTPSTPYSPTNEKPAPSPVTVESLYEAIKEQQSGLPPSPLAKNETPEPKTSFPVPAFVAPPPVSAAKTAMFEPEPEPEAVPAPETVSPAIDFPTASSPAAPYAAPQPATTYEPALPNTPQPIASLEPEPDTTPLSAAAFLYPSPFSAPIIQENAEKIAEIAPHKNFAGVEITPPASHAFKPEDDVAQNVEVASPQVPPSGATAAHSRSFSSATPEATTRHAAASQPTGTFVEPPPPPVIVKGERPHRPAFYSTRTQGRGAKKEQE